MVKPGSLWLPLILVATLTAAANAADPQRTPADSAPAQPFPPPDARRRPGSKDSPEVINLLRQRRDSVKAELDVARKYFGDPDFRADAWSALAERLLVAETDAAETPAERIAAYRNFRDNLKLMEDQLKAVPEPQRGQGFFEYGQKLWIRGRRLQAEVSLLRAELTKGETVSPAEEPSAVRDALLAWRDSVRQWAKMWLESRMVLVPPFAKEIASTVLGAELAAAKDSTEQIAAYQGYRDRLLAVEKDTKSEVERRRYNAFDYLRIKEMRCEADVVLGRLKVGGDKPPAVDPPDVRTALADWLETIGFEAEVIRKHYEPAKPPPADSLIVNENLLHEELTAATKPEARIAAYTKFLGKLKEAEASLKSRPESSPADKVHACRVTYNRAATELTLLQLAAAPGAQPGAARKILLKEQRTCLQSELGLRMAEWAAGFGDFQGLQEGAGHLLLAELESADTPAEKLAAYQAHTERMRAADEQCKLLIKAKKGSDVWLLWTQGARLEAEIWLLRAKRNLALPAKP